jgi:hypothetical protein
MLLKVIALLLILIIFYTIHKECEDSSIFILAISLFVTYIWISPSIFYINKMPSHRKVHHYIIYVLTIMLILIYVLYEGLVKPESSCAK